MADLKLGTTFRLPIKITGFIEITTEPTDLNVEVVVDKFDYDYAAWPRVSGFGEDDLIVQMDRGEGERYLSGDADYVSEIRAIAERRLDGFTKWRISKTVEEDITEGSRVG